MQHSVVKLKKKKITSNISPFIHEQNRIYYWYLSKDSLFKHASLIKIDSIFYNIKF